MCADLPRGITERRPIGASASSMPAKCQTPGRAQSLAAASPKRLPGWQKDSEFSWQNPASMDWNNGTSGGIHSFSHEISG